MMDLGRPGKGFDLSSIRLEEKVAAKSRAALDSLALMDFAVDLSFFDFLSFFGSGADDGAGDEDLPLCIVTSKKEVLEKKLLVPEPFGKLTYDVVSTST